MASVRQLTAPNREGRRPWVVEYTDKAGKRRRATPPSGLKRDAEKLRIKIEAEVETGLHVPASQALSVADLIGLYLSDCEHRVKTKDNFRPSSLEQSRLWANKYITPYIGRVPVTEIKPLFAQNWIETVAKSSDRNLSKLTFRGVLGVLRRAMAFAERKGFVPQNSLLKVNIKLPGKAPRRVSIPTKDELRTVLTKVKIKRRVQGGNSKYFPVMVYVAIYCGLRIGEIRALSWENVDFVEKLIRVRCSMDIYCNIGEPKTENSYRDVPIPPVLLQELKEYFMLVGRPETGLVFLSRFGTPVHYNAVHKMWRKFLGRSFGTGEGDNVKPQFHFHALRHCYASLLIEAGLPPKRVQYLMGHSSITMTFDRYGHLFDDPALVDSAMEKLGTTI